MLVSALSYIATTNAIVWQGARPIFCDVDPVTLNIDPADIERRITPRTKALLVADYCGSPVDYDAIQSICSAHRITLVVDGAQSLGATHRGRPACSLGLVSTTSFHAAKAMVCGEGGMVFCDVPELAERARKLRGQGESPERKYLHDTLAFNYRLTDVAAAIGRVQLTRAERVHDHRAELAAAYAEQLRSLPEAQPTEHTRGGKYQPGSPTRCASATARRRRRACGPRNRDALARIRFRLTASRSLSTAPCGERPPACRGGESRGAEPARCSRDDAGRS